MTTQWCQRLPSEVALRAFSWLKLQAWCYSEAALAEAGCSFLLRLEIAKKCCATTYLKSESRFKCERQMLATCFLCAWMISCARCRLPVVTFAALRGVKLSGFVSLVHRCAPMNICRISHRFRELFGAFPSSHPAAVQQCSRPCEMQQVGRTGRYLSDDRV